jgi:hypothetical protein
MSSLSSSAIDEDSVSSNDESFLRNIFKKQKVNNIEEV